AVEGGAAELDRTLEAAARRADRISGGSATIVFTATGSIVGSDVDAVDPADVSGQIEARHGAPVVEAAVPGGLFLDQDELARRKINEDDVLRSLTSVTLPNAPQRLFADVFPAIAVAFGRYC
ncbi:MAG: hypothetical protein M3273_02825, partial [Actinomycetota bacterium]|nr:hypothetical protein [Actinomycetota bacterium]